MEDELKLNIDSEMEKFLHDLVLNPLAWKFLRKAHISQALQALSLTIPTDIAKRNGVVQGLALWLSYGEKTLNEKERQILKDIKERLK